MIPEALNTSKFLLNELTISSQLDLKAIIRKLKEAIAAGDVQQCWPTDAPFATDAEIADVNEDGPWPDYIEWYFVSRDQNRKYKLSVDTYHGAGGAWIPLS